MFDNLSPLPVTCHYFTVSPWQPLPVWYTNVQSPSLTLSYQCLILTNHLQQLLAVSIQHVCVQALGYQPNMFSELSNKVDVTS